MSRFVVVVAFALAALAAGCAAEEANGGGVIVLPDAKVGDSVVRLDVELPDVDLDAEVGPDVAKDAKSDAAPDVAVDVALEVKPDVATDSAGDADADAGPDVTAVPPPTTGPALRTWLEAGSYLTWTHETTPHLSVGGHDGNVRTYLDPILTKSLKAGQTSYPVGAAAVMELYKTTGDQTFGWVVWVKTAAASDGGKNIFWYWLLDGDAKIAAKGSPNCTGCHSAGVDFLHTGFPLN
ncbi:MAG: hypothetical protein R3F39_04285 [Myxococcota bacterium]